MIKIFRGGRGGDTFKTPSPYEQLLPLSTSCFKMFLERSLNDPHPHHPTSSTFHCYPPPHPPPLPPLKILIIHMLSHVFVKRPNPNIDVGSLRLKQLLSTNMLSHVFARRPNPNIDVGYLRLKQLLSTNMLSDAFFFAKARRANPDIDVGYQA